MKRADTDVHHDHAPETADSVTIRSLEQLGEFRQCLELQEITWGRDFVEKVPPLLMKVVHRNGGVVAGAVDSDGALLGFVFGIAGLEKRDPYHWSHMLAVRPEARGLGLGRELKLFQREELLGREIDRALWSYDPLVSRNAHLNFNRLGVLTDDYVVDMYGQDTGSRLHAGLGTDRLVVRWQLDSPRTCRTISGARDGPARETADAPVIVEGSDGSTAAPSTSPYSEARVVRVEVPRDIQQLKRDAPSTARSWRDATRRAIRHYLDSGYGIDGLLRTDGGRCYYVLERGLAGRGPES